MTPPVLRVSLVAAVFGACIVVPLMAHGVVSGVATMMTGHPLKYWYPWKKKTQSQPSLPNRNPKPSSGRVQTPFSISPVTVLTPMLATGIPPAQYPNVVPRERWIPASAAAVEVFTLDLSLSRSCCFRISSSVTHAGTSEFWLANDKAITKSP